MSDLGSHDHPEIPGGAGVSARITPAWGGTGSSISSIFWALAVALRYEAEPDAAFLRPARSLLDVETASQAEVLGIALRLAYTLSAGTKDLLAGNTNCELRVLGWCCTCGRTVAFSPGRACLRRLERLAQALGLQAAAEADLAEVAE